MSVNVNSPLAAALAYLSAGLSVVPIRRDGSKAPAVRSWKTFQARLPTEAEVRRWFAGPDPPGVAVIGGDVSGGLEQLDFDAEAESIFPEWCALVEAEAPDLLPRLSVARTPKGGYHVRYRCPDMKVPGNTKLALDPTAKTVLIETRGEGGYALAPGCPAECHESGRLYEHHSGPPLERIQAIGFEERDILIRCARSFDRTPPPESTANGKRSAGLSPGDDYDQGGPDWPTILEPHGWVAVQRRSAVTFWRRPGKDGCGWSATTGACTSKAGRSLFYVFSSNSAPFEPNHGYSKFATYAILNHGGDFSAAARALVDEGYGEKRRRPSRNGTAKSPDQPSESAQSVPSQQNNDVHQTDLGNARRVVKRHGNDLRYCFPWKTWLHWDGQRWAEDQTGEAVRRVKETQGSLFKWAESQLKELAAESEDEDEDEERKAKIKVLRNLLMHLLKWEDTRAITRCLESARSEPGVPVLPADLDRDQYLFNVLNGTIDLRTGQLRPHRREDRITKLAPVEHDPDAKCPLWERCLDRWMNGNRNLTRYLHRLSGYGLTADVSEQSLWFFYGLGANGKSTFIITLLTLMGDYAMQAVSDLLMQKRNESHPTERADLFGKRFVATIETDEGRRMAEALMKQLTGGDKVRARKCFKDFFEFLPTHKIILAANHKPTIRGTDHATWRRVKMVPWTAMIGEAEKDKQLMEKLKAELPGILNWLVAGCLDWQREGLGEPDEVRQATTEYRAEQDFIQGFIDQCCLLHPEAKANSSGLLKAYLDWSGDKEMTVPAFRKRMKDKGFESKEGTGGRWFWHGLRLRSDTDEGGDSGGKWG